MQVWYNNDMSPNSSWTLCAAPNDPDCHDSAHARDRFDDHRNYFGVHVSRYGKAGCPTLNFNITDGLDESQLQPSEEDRNLAHKIAEAIPSLWGIVKTWLFN